MLYLALEENMNNEDTYKEITLLNETEYYDKDEKVYLTFGKWYTSKELAILNLFGDHVFKRMMQGIPSKNFWLLEIDPEKSTNLDVIIDGEDDTDPRYLYDVNSPDTTTELVDHKNGRVFAELYKLFNVDKNDVIKTNGYRYGTFASLDTIEDMFGIIDINDVESYGNGFIAAGTYNDIKEDRYVEYKYEGGKEWKDIATLKKNEFKNKPVMYVRVPMEYNYIFDYSPYPHDYVHKNDIPIRKIYRIDLANTFQVDNVTVYRTFEPRIPSSAMIGECTESERVCFSTTFIGCLSAVPWMWESVDNSNYNGTLVWITEYVDIDDGSVIYETSSAVPDAPITEECWLMKKIRARSRLAVIKNVYYTNVSYQVKTKVDDMVSYETAIDRISRMLFDRRFVYTIDGHQVTEIEDAKTRLKNGEELYYDANTAKITKADVEYVKQEDITMSRDIEIAELIRLNDRIKECDIAYYQNNTSLISDYEYDMLVKRAEELLEKYPDMRNNINKDGHNGNMVNGIVFDKVGTGTTNTPFKKVKHVVPMLSLKNTYNRDELTNFVKGLVKVIGEGKDKWSFSLDLEYKMDGISCEILYDKGFIKQGITRGDGEYGEDITHNIRACRLIPHRINCTEPIRLRGELVIDYRSFEIINNINELEGREKYANPRNLVSGVMRRDEPNYICEQHVKFIPYGLVDYTKSDNSHYKAMNSYLPTLDIYTPIEYRDPYKVNQDTDIDELINNINKDLDSMYNQKKDISIYPTDGAVIKLDDASLRESFGDTSKYPKWAIAYKFKDDIVSTRLVAVNFQVGRSGRITPVARLNPVQLNGSTITYATLHNFEEIERLGIKIGEMVDLKKAAEVIPKVIGKSAVQVGEDDRYYGYSPIKIPSKCPECGTEIVVENLGDVYCPNEECGGRVKAAIEYFVSKPCMNIVGLGPKTINAFYSKGVLKSVADVYKIPSVMITQSTAIGKIIASINDSKNQPLTKLLISLGIPNCGPSFFKELTKKYTTMDAIYEALEKGAFDNKYVAYKSLASWLNDPVNKKLIETLKSYGLNMTVQNKSLHGIKFKDITYAITGKSDLVTRDELALFIVDNGGDVSKSISKNVDILLYGDKAGGKLEDARKRGITLYSINDFIDDNRVELASYLKRSL